MAVRVFLLDDHEVVRAGIRALLEPEDDMEVVGEAGTAEEAIRRLPATRPTVALLDVRLPDGSGIEVCRQVRSEHPEIGCLMLSSYADDEALMAAVLAGAAGYVLKQVGGSDLVADVRTVAAGGSLLDPDLVRRAVARLHQPIAEDPRMSTLTVQERNVLDQIALGRTNREIGEALYLAEKTVKNYVSNVLTKLDMKHRTEAALFASRENARRRGGTGTSFGGGT